MKYKVQAPDGSMHIIEGPDNATPQQIEQAASHMIPNQAMQQPPFQPQIQQPQAQQPLSWGDVGIRALSNIPSSAGDMLSGIGRAIRHPINTAQSILDLGAGELRKIVPKPVRNLIDKMDWNPQATQKADATANAINDFYSNRYGSVEGFKQALATDPVGVATDVSTVLGVGGFLAPGKAGAALSRASQLTNPLYLTTQGVKGVVKGAGTLTKNVLGVTTGAGKDAIGQAYQAGKTGNTAFTQNMRGKVPMTDVLDAAKANLTAMKIAKSAEYRTNMQALAQDQSVLDFNAINNAVKTAKNMGNFKGVEKNAYASRVIGKIGNTIDEWKNLNPAEYHTPEGMDALKQKVWGVMERIPPKQKTAQYAAQGIYNTIKQTIEQQAPAYSDMMSSYSNASDTINQIQKSLSLGENASKDTALRKLQSLMRNNVNTNYGYREQLAKQLEAAGQPIMPALAGQALSSATPRGLQQLGMYGTFAASLHNPLFAAMVPLESPRLVGELAYLSGRGSGLLSKALGMVPGDPYLTGLLASQAGQIGNR